MQNQGVGEGSEDGGCMYLVFVDRKIELLWKVNALEDANCGHRERINEQPEPRLLFPTLMMIDGNDLTQLHASV